MIRKKRANIAWEPPKKGWSNFNVDGAERSELGAARIGVLRNERGGALCSFSFTLRAKEANVAKTLVVT